MTEAGAEVEYLMDTVDLAVDGRDRGATEADILSVSNSSCPGISLASPTDAP